MLLFGRVVLCHIYLLCKYIYAVQHSKLIRQLNVQVESLITAHYLQYLQSSVLPALPTCRDLQQLNINDCSVPRSRLYSLQDNTDTRPEGDFIIRSSFPSYLVADLPCGALAFKATSELSSHPIPPTGYYRHQTYRDPGTKPRYPDREAEAGGALQSPCSALPTISRVPFRHLRRHSKLSFLHDLR